MTNRTTVIDSLDMLLDEPQPPALFADGQPTYQGLRWYAEGALSNDAEAAIEAALEDPAQARRLERIVADADARARAMVRALCGESHLRSVVALSARADAMLELCRAREARIAAAASVAGVVQTADSEDLVTLKIAEVFDAASDEGDIEVEVHTFDDPRLVDARATLQVTAGGVTLSEYNFEVRDRSFTGRFGIRRMPHDSGTVEFRLYLHAKPE